MTTLIKRFIIVSLEDGRAYHTSEESLTFDARQSEYYLVIDTLTGNTICEGFEEAIKEFS